MERLQQQRLQREERRAEERAKAQQAHLFQRQREAGTRYGAVLLNAYAETVSIAIDQLLSQLVSKSETAGPFFNYWPLLLHFCNRGPRSIALIALSVVIDHISQRPTRQALAGRIGAALLAECRAKQLQDKHGAVLFVQLRKKYGRTAARADMLRKLYVAPESWKKADCRGLGNLLLEVIKANTALAVIPDQQKGLVEPTEDTRQLIATNPPLPLSPRALPSLMPPERWTGPTRGNKPLVCSRAPMNRSHLTADALATALIVVNAVEQQEVVIDPWMVQVQREAWDCDLPVFNVRRNPGEMFSLPQDVHNRCRIEESIRQGEEIGGMPIWLEHDMDFRGRLYCASRVAGHQGTDQQKALLSFAQQERMSDDAFEQLLAAAAGHYGLGHSSWGERVEWGRSHLDQMAAIAQQPLDRIDLWKSADDPWQFLQCSAAIADYLSDESALIGCPVRFDQTASGMGIAAMLTRDEQLARHTNIIGSTRKDLYAHVALRLQGLLRADLDSFDFFDQRMAEFWLQKPFGRDLTKGPTMTTIYGARHFGLVDQVVTWLQEENPDVHVSRWAREYTKPAQYLTRKLNLVIGAELKACVELEKWLRAVSTKCIRAEKPVRWDSPMSFPLAFANRLDHKQRTNTYLHGRRRWQHVDVTVEEGELSARATNQAITANTIHAFDAALCHAVVIRSASKGMPILTNHDCFATIPSRAKALHHILLDEMRQMYATDWLAEMRVEVGQNAKVQLPHPPRVGTLGEGLIGQNPYCFC